MKFRLFLPCALASVIFLASFADVVRADESKHQWKDPEAKKRYDQHRKELMNTYGDESKTMKNLDRGLESVQNAVRDVRDGAIKGAVIGGAPGAVTGAGKGAVEALRAVEALKKGK